MDIINALTLARRVIFEYENLDERAPVFAECGECNQGTGPNRQTCAYHQARAIVNTDANTNAAWRLHEQRGREHAEAEGRLRTVTYEWE
jgi:hypothetical protein